VSCSPDKHEWILKDGRIKCALCKETKRTSSGKPVTNMSIAECERRVDDMKKHADAAERRVSAMAFILGNALDQHDWNSHASANSDSP